MIKIALIGGGNFGIHHLKNLLRIENEKKCEFIGVVENSKPQIEKIKKQFDCRVENSLEKILDEVDAFDIVTPPSTHYFLTKKCLLAGKHVLVEKPMTTEFESSIELFNLAVENKKKLAVGHVFRYDPITFKAIDLIQTDVGSISFIEGKFVNPREPRTDVGALLNFSHWIDLCNYLLKLKPTQLNCISFKKIGNKFEDDVLLTMDYKNNVQTRLHMSWLGRKKSRYLKLDGSLLTVVLDYKNRIIETIKGEGNNFESDSTKVELTPTTEPLYKEIVDFLECINSNKQPLSDSYSGILASYIAKKAFQSINNQKIIQCDIDYNDFGGLIIN